MATMSLPEEILPRLYQQEIVDLATQRNVVAYLDTGSGKTFMSVMLLKHRLELHREASAAAAAAVAGAPPLPRWLGIFVAPQVSLVHQQAAVLARHLSVRVAAFIGSETDHWTPAEWLEALEKNDLYVMTPQILVNLFSHAIFPGGISSVDIICFDEAHHCRKRHPYNVIMDFYRAAVAQGGPVPHIFGMSAAPATGKQSAISLTKSLNELERNLAAKVVTVIDRTSVEDVVPQPDLALVRYPPASADTALLQGPLAGLQGVLEHEIARLDIATQIGELGWAKEVQEYAGGNISDTHTTSNSVLYVSFEPGAPKFKATKLRDALRSVLNVLESIGLYGAAHCTLETFKWLAAGAPDSRVYSYSQYYDSKSGSNTEDAFGARQGDVRFKALLVQYKAKAAGISLDDGSSMSQVCQQASVAVLKAYTALLSPCATTSAQDIEALETSVQAGKRVGNAVCKLMDALVKNISPSDVDASLGISGSSSHTTAATSAAAAAGQQPRFAFPLVAPKTAALIKTLLNYRELATTQSRWSGIVFVQLRMASMALAALLQHTQCCSGWLKVSPFMAQGASFGGLSFLPHEQTDILRRFRLGELNLLVSTSVAEEGIDVKGCQLVVRFDPAPSAQSFQQSRGRARMKGSHLIALVEEGNEAQEFSVRAQSAYNTHLREVAVENAQRAEGGEEDSEDEDAMVLDFGDDLQDGVAGSSDAPYIVPSTGATVSLQNSLVLLAKYVSKLPADEFMLLRAAYRLEYLTNDNVRAIVRLPGSSPVITAEGNETSSKRRAKASAALAACRALHAAGALDDRLLPAVLAVDGDEEESLNEVEEVVANVEIHSDLPAALATSLCVDDTTKTARLYCYAWTPSPASMGDEEGEGELALQEGEDERAIPLGIVLPKALTSDGLSIDFASDALGGLVAAGDLTVDAEQLRMVLDCSMLLRRFAASWCIREPFVNSPPTYALVQLVRSSQGGFTIDWDATRRVLELQAALDAGTTVLDVLRSGTPEDRLLEGSILVTKYNSMQYIYKEIAHNLCLDSPFPSDREDTTGPVPATFAEYYAQRWGQDALDAAQPLLSVSRATDSQLRSYDGRYDGKPAFIVPELCYLHPIPPALRPALAAAPRRVWRLEGGLIAYDLLQYLVDSGISPDSIPHVSVVRRALTAPSALDTSGDYETLEAMGDGFLKYAVCAQQFLKYPGHHEGQLTAAKDRLVSNARLIKVALTLNMERRVRFKPFVDGMDDEDTNKAAKRNAKLLADSVEALIGAFRVGAGEHAALGLLRHLGLGEIPWDALEVASLPPLGGWEPGVDIDAVQNILHYSFSCPWLIQEALTHGSYPGTRCYQRLEFLGDSLLDVCLISHIHKINPEATPAQLHDSRSVALNFERLALCAIRHGVHTHIRHSHSLLFHMFDTYVTAVEDCVATASGGSASPSPEVWEQFIVQNTFGLPDHTAPKVFCDVVEALIGAVWVDSKGSLETTWKEMAAKAGTIAEFVCVQGDGEGVAAKVVVGGECLGQGPPGHNMVTASRMAAQAALVKLEMRDGRR